MNIALASDWFAPRRGGIEYQLGELATRLAARGHRVDVLTTTPGAIATSPAYRVRELAVARLPGIDIAVSPRLVQALRAELMHDYDLLHAHASVVSPLAYAAAAAAVALRLPTVLTFHSVLHLKRYLLAAADTLLNVSQRGVVWTGVSELVASQLRAALPDGYVTTLPNAVDVGFWRAGRTRPSADHVTFVSTSRLHGKKRPAELLRAFARARREFRESVRLVLLGEGNELARLRRLRQDLGLATPPTVELGGWIARETLRELYHRSDAFILASRNESFGIASLEARAAGLPVIAMRAAGSTEFLRDGVDALLCDDDEDLSDAMVRLVNDPGLRCRLRDDNPRLSYYDWSAALDRHEEVYRCAMARAGAAIERAGA